MDRRSFLTGASTLALSQILAACSGKAKEILRIHLLKNSIPAQLIPQIRRVLGQSIGLELNPESQLADLFTRLQALKDGAEGSDSTFLPDFFQSKQQDGQANRQELFTLGNYWLAKAIQQDLIRPLQPSELTHWDSLPSRWKTFVTRDDQGNLTPQGQVWGAPYRWGTTVIAYRKDKFERLGWIPSDWDALWQPELTRRISVLDQPREVIGLTLKKLGRSYNSEDIRAISGLEAELRSLHQQVKLYSSEAYLQPLILGDTWLAVGWFTDVIPLLRRNSQISAVVPRSGTALWADLWVCPASTNPTSTQAAVNRWIDIWWQPQIASQLSRLSSGGSPLLTGPSLDRLAQDLLLPNQEGFNRSDFIRPLPDTAIDQYRSLWLKIRSTS